MKWILGLAIAVIVGVSWWTGALAELADADQLRELVAEAGAAGPVVFVGVVTLLSPVLLAGPPIWMSGTIWPIPIAIVYAVTAVSVASLIFFGIARWLGRDWAAEHVPDKLRKYEQRLERHPYRTIILLRALFWINPAVDVLIGMSAVSTAAYLGASVLVLTPLTVLHVTLPAKGIELAAAAPEWLGPAVGGALALGIAVWAIRKRRLSVAG